MQEIICAVQPLPGSKPAGSDNPNNYMGYDRTNWQLFDQEVQTGAISNVDGIVYKETFIKKKKIADNELAYVLDYCDQKIAFVVEKSDGAEYIHKNDAIGMFLDSIGTSGCISLIQKAIRRRPKTMQHPESGELFLTELIVERITLRMCCGKQRGFFLPTIGKFVTALEHFLKRLFVIAAEDSEYLTEILFFVSMNAFVAAKLPHWKPSSTFVARMVEISYRLLQSSVTSHYNTTKSCVGHVSDFVQKAPAVVHKFLGGMGGDQKMLCWLAKHPHDQNRIGTAKQPKSGCDPLDIYCDQHQEGRLVCFLQAPEVAAPPNVFIKASTSAFFAVSGWNTRREPRPKELSVEQQMVFDGLRASSKMLRLPPAPVDCQSSCNETLEWVVPLGALAGMVGSIEISHKRAKYFVTVSTHDLSQFVVIPKPSRDNKKNMGDITPEQFNAIVLKAKALLYIGKRANNIADESFLNSTIRLRNNVWSLNNIPWTTARNVTTQLSKTVDWSYLKAPCDTDWSWTTTFGKGQTFRRAVIQWCLGRMSGFSSMITIPKINRMGAGTDEALTGLEAEGFQYLIHLSKHYPDALWPSKPFTFHTKCIALRKQLCARLANEQVSECEWPVWSSQMTLRPTQQIAFNGMLQAFSKGLSSFLWMLVGQGKTLTVLSFLEATRASRFVVWSLPKSAVGSVAEIITKVGWSPVILFPSKGLAHKYEKEGGGFPSTTSTILQPNKITIIEHDHLRKLADKLASQMCDTSFIFDEVHKAMQSGTQRTGAALRLARLSKQPVALTGTPIVDKSGYGLMEWLRLCVPYSVTPVNFWVAANSMVTQLNTGDVQVSDEIIQSDETVEEASKFHTHFPKRAPWYGKTDIPTRDIWIQLKKMTTNICNRTIVTLVHEMYNNHPEDWRADHINALQTGKGGQRPLVVASDQGHAVELIDKMIEMGIHPSEILLVGGTRPSNLQVDHVKSIHLTEQRVLDGTITAYKVVVAALHNCEGYSLTWMTCMITGSYPSNQATRTQIRGRINRLDAQRLHKHYITVLSGITTITHRHQEAAKLMEDALRAAPPTKKRKLNKLNN